MCRANRSGRRRSKQGRQAESWVIMMTHDRLGAAGLRACTAAVVVRVGQAVGRGVVVVRLVSEKNKQLLLSAPGLRTLGQW